MEAIIGMMLFLQILIVIQIMLMGKQVLQRITEIEKKLSDLQKIEKEKLSEEEPLFIQEKSMEIKRNFSKDKAEELINEVLSEVFS